MGHDLNYLRTLMILHCGRGVWRYSDDVYYVRPATPPEGPTEQHEVEKHNARYYREASRGKYFWSTEREALEAYCKFYKLGPYRIPAEVS